MRHEDEKSPFWCLLALTLGGVLPLKRVGKWCCFLTLVWLLTLQVSASFWEPFGHPFPHLLCQSPLSGNDCFTYVKHMFLHVWAPSWDPKGLTKVGLKSHWFLMCFLLFLASFGRSFGFPNPLQIRAPVLTILGPFFAPAAGQARGGAEIVKKTSKSRCPFLPQFRHGLAAIWEQFASMWRSKLGRWDQSSVQRATLGVYEQSHSLGSAVSLCFVFLWWAVLVVFFLSSLVVGPGGGQFLRFGGFVSHLGLVFFTQALPVQIQAMGSLFVFLFVFYYFSKKSRSKNIPTKHNKTARNARRKLRKGSLIHIYILYNSHTYIYTHRHGCIYRDVYL